MNAKKLAKLGMLLAIAIVLKYLSFYIPIGGILGIRVGFMEIPIVIAGITAGPVWGGLLGVLYDVFGYILNPSGGPYFPGFAVSFFLIGVLAGLFPLFKKERISYKDSLLYFAIVGIFIDLLLNTFWLSMLYGQPYGVLFVPRIFSTAVMVAVKAYVLKLLFNVLKDKNIIGM